MKFLEIPTLESFNNLIGQLITKDGTRIMARLDAFTCKLLEINIKGVLTRNRQSSRQ